MKTILITAAIIFSIHTYDAMAKVEIVEITHVEEIKEKVVKVPNLIKAIIYVESRDNDSAYNKSEDAVGCLQIRPIMVREVNRLLQKRKDNRVYTLSDRWNRQKSIEMFLVYNKNVIKFEHQARRWNGGPGGMNKAATIKYWNKVRQKL